MWGARPAPVEVDMALQAVFEAGSGELIGLVRVVALTVHKDGSRDVLLTPVGLGNCGGH